MHIYLSTLKYQESVIYRKLLFLWQIFMKESSNIKWSILGTGILLNGDYCMKTVFILQRLIVVAEMKLSLDATDLASLLFTSCSSPQVKRIDNVLVLIVAHFYLFVSLFLFLKKNNVTANFTQ